MGVFSSKPEERNITTPTPKPVKKAGVFAPTSDGRMATDLPKASPKIDTSALLRGVKAGPSSIPKTPPSLQDTKVDANKLLKGIPVAGSSQPKQIKYSKDFVPNTQIGQANPNNTTMAPKGTLYEEAIKSMRPSFVKEKSDLSSDEQKDNINIDIPFTKERVLSFKNPIPQTVARNTKQVAEFAGNLPDVFAESVPRAVVSTGLALNPAAPKEIDPTTFGGEAIFGNKPIKNFTGIGNESGVQNPFLAPFVGATYTALDLWPGTAGKAKLLTTLGKETVDKEVNTILKREVRNLSDELIAEISPIIAKTTDRKEIDLILNNAIKQYKDELRQSAVRPKTVQEAIVRGGEDNVAIQTNKALPEPTQAVQAPSKYRAGSDLINPNYTDDVQSYDKFMTDVISLPKKEARDVAISRVDDIVRDNTEAGMEQFKAVVDTFGRTDARKIVREGIMSDTMRPAEINKLFDAKLAKLDDIRLADDLPVQILNRGTRYYPLGRGPKIESSKVQDLLAHIIPEGKVEFVFDPEFLKKYKALGRFSYNEKMEYLNPKLKPIIDLFEKKGKVYVRTAFHEANHYLETKVFSKEFVQKLDDETLSLMNDADHSFYAKRGYKTPEARAAEYRSDEFARIESKKAGYVSPLEKVWNLVKDAVNGISNTAKRFKEYVTSLPNRQGGFVSAGGKKKLSQELEDKARYVEAKQFALDNHPARGLAKYAATRGEFAGQLPEVTGKGSTFGKKGDKIIQDLTNDYYEYPEDARRGYEEYVSKQKELARLKKELKQETYAYEAKQYLAKKEVDKKAAESADVAKTKDATQSFVAKGEQEKKRLPSITPKEEPKKPNYTPEKTQEFTDALNAASKLAAEKRDYAIRVREIVKEANRPSFQPTSLYQRLQKSLAPVKFLDKNTKEIYRDWKRKLLVGKELANEDARILSKIPQKDGMKTIRSYESGANTAYRKEIQGAFDSLLKEANDRGLDIVRRDNYVPHVYKESPAEIKNLVGVRMAEKGFDQGAIKDYLDGVGQLSPEQAKSLKLKPSFTKERTFDTYADAEAFGLHPKYENPAELVAYYRHEMEKTFANKEFMKKLEVEGKILPDAIAPRGWEEVKLNYGGARWYAPKEFARVINGQIRDENMLGFTDKIFNMSANVSKKMQEIALSAGVPNSNINFFSTGQMIKQLTSGDFKAVVPYLRANFNGPTMRYFERKQPLIKTMAGQGIDLGGRIGNYADLYSSLSKKYRDGGFKELAGATFDKLFNEKTFGSYMPQVYIGTFEGALKKGLKKGMTKEEAEGFAGEVTKKFMGMIEDNGRSLATEDKLSAVFFAPKFREGIINTLLNTGRSVTTQIKNPAFYRNRQLLAGMLLTYAGYNALNKKLNGNYMWENEKGKEFALKIPRSNGEVIYIEFMPSFLAFARSMGSGLLATARGDLNTAGQKFGSVFSMPVKMTTDIITNSDYFGRPIYKDTDTGSTKALKIAGYAGLQVNHPYIKEVLKQSGIKNPTAKAILNVPDEKPPLYQTLSNMFELPFKFTTQQKIADAEFYDALDKQKITRARETEAVVPKYEEIQALIKEGKEPEAQEKLDALTDEEYAIYKNIRAADKRKLTIEAKRKLLPTYNEVQKLRQSGNEDAAMEIVNNMTDDEYDTYSSLMNQFKGATTDTITREETPKYQNGTKTNEDGIIDTVFTYAQAIGVDPVTAFDRIFTGQKIRRVDNGTIIIERMSMEESQAIKKAEGKDNPMFKLDHTIPLQLGGSNKRDNGRIITTAEWASYTEMENYLGKLLRNDKISKKEAQDLIVKFKLGEIKADDIYQQYK